MIEVVSGFIVKDGRALLTQRPAEKDCPFAWETPGGKVEGNESNHGALRRELLEELGIKVGAIPEHSFALEMFENGIPERGLKPFIILCYLVTQYTGKPVPREGQGLGWFTPEEIKGLSLAPGNTLMREKLLDMMHQLEKEARP